MGEDGRAVARRCSDRGFRKRAEESDLQIVHRRGKGILGISTVKRRRPAESKKRSRGEIADRQLHSAKAGREESQARSARRQADLASTRDVRFDGSASD